MFRELFYDLEAFANLWTCSIFSPQTNSVDVYYLCDEKSLLDENGDYIDIENCTKKIKEVNSTILDKNATINYYNLHNEYHASKFASEFVKLSIRNMPMFLSDTDKGYNKDHGSMIFGYNSANYDTTCLAFYFGNVWRIENGVNIFVDTINAVHMYEFNNLLFSQYKDRMSDALGKEGFLKDLYWSMMNSGRHIDVSNFNEKQRKSALKRLLGTLGYQIKESELLDSGNTTPVTTFEMFNEAIAYNVSDVCGLERLFRDDIYASAFELKSGLLETYPELVYDRPKSATKYGKRDYKPNISPDNVKYGRLHIDSTSANFATKCLCPYERLKDDRTVSFLYPSEEKAKELGMKQINVLDNLWEWYQEAFKDFPDITKAFKTQIYDYYKQIEGKNFNSGENYIKDYGKVVCYNPSTLRPLSEVYASPKVLNGCIEYYNANGNSTGCYAQFSIGGIHGAEYNIEKYKRDAAEAKKTQELFNKVKAIYPNPYDLRVAKTVTIGGVNYKFSDFLKLGATIKNPDSCVYKEVTYPVLFQQVKKSYTLNDKYTYTSSALCDHEDFSSYYSSMLINMSAMYNEGLGYDRYAEIYEQKENYGKLMKCEEYSRQERKIFKNKRAGTKLILNSASGAGDLSYDTPIRMNNKILSMRLIGQFFTFRMAQEQSLVGARIISTNTDGIYVITPNKDLTRGILSELEKFIQVKIEPEEMILISKDTNNRIEFSVDGKKILSANGETLACYEKPSSDKALSHPAIIDNGLVTWLQCKGKDLAIIPTIEQMVSFLQKFIKVYSTERVLLMFQNILSSSTGSCRYHTLVKDFDGFMEHIKAEQCVAIQHYNRMYFVKPEYSNEHLVMTTQRVEANTHPKNEEEAIKMLHKFGVHFINKGNMATFIKSNGIDPTKTIRIYNKPIVNSDVPYELKELINQLDLEAYAVLIRDKFINCWSNAIV